MAAASPHSEKLQNLPLLCVETILKFTPTSKLVRLTSNVVPLPGVFWSLGLQTVLKKRLPLTLRDEHPYRRLGDPCSDKALFDITGAKIATVKKPDVFRFCPLREFVESATLTVRLLRMSWINEPLQSNVLRSNGLLAHLPNVIHLALVVHDICYQCEGKDLFEPCLNHLLPKLQSFEVHISPDCRGMVFLGRVLEAFVNLIEKARINDMNCLRRLALRETPFDYLIRTAAMQSTEMQAVFAGLSTLGIGYVYGALACTGPAALNFVLLRCEQLSQLQVVVRGEFRAYLTAFRALQCLTSLGLYVAEADLTGLTFDGTETISSVTDFRIVSRAHAYRTDIFKIATFFPNARAVALKVEYHPGPLELATSLFGQRQLFPAIAKLGCFYLEDMLYLRRGLLTQFLANPHLPETVDLSQFIFVNLALDANLLTAIFCAMQASSIKRLLLRGPVSRAALPRLQSHIGLNGETAKVSAWKDRDLGDQPGISGVTDVSEQTEFNIIGTKTSGCLKGGQFAIRVFHQLAKRVDIFS